MLEPAHVQLKYLKDIQSVGGGWWMSKNDIESQITCATFIPDVVAVRSISQ